MKRRRPPYWSPEPYHRIEMSQQTIDELRLIADGGLPARQAADVEPPSWPGLSSATRCARGPDPAESRARGETGDRLMAAKYHEEIHRYPALLEGGRTCEILERVTFEREELPDGSLGEPRVCNRRFDLRTGERVNALGGDDFELDLEKTRLRRVRES